MAITGVAFLCELVLVEDLSIDLGFLDVDLHSCGIFVLEKEGLERGCRVILLLQLRFVIRQMTLVPDIDHNRAAIPVERNRRLRRHHHLRLELRASD